MFEQDDRTRPLPHRYMSVYSDDAGTHGILKLACISLGLKHTRFIDRLRKALLLKELWSM